jgi:hypothetical protein
VLYQLSYTPVLLKTAQGSFRVPPGLKLSSRRHEFLQERILHFRQKKNSS